MQFLISLLNWLSICTRSDIATITKTSHQIYNLPSKLHIKAGKGIVWYIKGTQHHGITFHSDSSKNLKTFIKFTIYTLIDFSDITLISSDRLFLIFVPMIQCFSFAVFQRLLRVTFFMSVVVKYWRVWKCSLPKFFFFILNYNGCSHPSLLPC